MLNASVTKKMKDEYIELVHQEMMRRGFTQAEIPLIIEKTNFIKTLNSYPEAQLHYDPYDAVNEILFVVAKNSIQATG